MEGEGGGIANFLDDHQKDFKMLSVKCLDFSPKGATLENFGKNYQKFYQYEFKANYSKRFAYPWQDLFYYLNWYCC